MSGKAGKTALADVACPWSPPENGQAAGRRLHAPCAEAPRLVSCLTISPRHLLGSSSARLACSIRQRGGWRRSPGMAE
jgi:hypothetical protein